MLIFLLRRAGYGLLTLFALVTVTFFLTRSFADPARIIVGPNSTLEQYENVRHAIGADRPIFEQFLSFLRDALSGDLGISAWYGEPALPIVVDRLPATLLLASSALLIATVGGLVLGLASVASQGSLLGRIASAIPALLVSLADFWVGIMLVMLFAVQLGWLPTSGYGTWQQLILPAVTLAMRPLGRTARMIQEAVVDELPKVYVTAARGRGLTLRQVVNRHVLKNVAPTAVNVLGFEFVLAFTGYSVLVETVFSWPGIGKLAADAVVHHDVVLITSVVVIAGCVVAIVNTLVDVIQSMIDRRLVLS